MGDTTTILFGGDCHFGDKPLRLGDRLQERIRQAEFVVVNQESPITTMDELAAEGGIRLRSSPAAIESLHDMRVRVVSLANNHMADCGREGLLETITRLQEAGVTPVGAGDDGARAAAAAHVALTNGQTVAFLGFTSRTIGAKIAGESYGCAPLEPDAVERAVGAARAAADHVVVMLHYGLTNFDYPTPQDRDVVRAAARSGAALVIGHHPHVLQGHEILDGVPVFYSLGNLIFAAYRKNGRIVPLSIKNRSGAFVAAAFSAAGVRVEEVVFTDAREHDDHLHLEIAADAVARARSFEARSRPLARPSYHAFFRRYALRRVFQRLLLWTSPRRWRTLSGAQLRSLWLSLSFVTGSRTR